MSKPSITMELPYYQYLTQKYDLLLPQVRFSRVFYQDEDGHYWPIPWIGKISLDLAKIRLALTR